MANDFFPPRPPSKPTIYAYEDTNPQYDGLLKVGYTTLSSRQRMDEMRDTKPSACGSGIHRGGGRLDGGAR